MHEPVIFPENARVSPEAIDFVKGLLTRDVNRRLGVKERGFRDLMNHAWFRNIQWDLLANKQCTPPFIPDVSFGSEIILGLITDPTFYRANVPTLIQPMNWKRSYWKIIL